MDKKVSQSYRPGEEHLKRFPETSGNEINGLGEREFRRPTPIFWRDPDSLEHGELQKLFYERVSAIQEHRVEVSQDQSRRGPEHLDPVAPEKVEKAPETFTRLVKDFALQNESDLVGIARLRPEWIYDDSTLDDEWIIVLGFTMNIDDFSELPPQGPPFKSADEVSRHYNRGARASKALTNFIRNLGWDASAHTGPWTGPVTLIPAAIQAGLGELGKHGSLINDRVGASFRLAAVSTSMPLVEDGPREFGVDDFCTSCQICTKACPPDAIFEDKQWLRGEKRWYVDFDKCIPYFIDTYGCGICIAECPWSRPGIAPRLAEKMLRRRARLAQ